MTDKATTSLRQRCDTALQSLPDAAYKTMLAALFDDLLGLAAQAAPTEAEYNPLLIDGVQHDPLCLKVYRSPLKECDCGASSRAAQPSQAPVVQAVQAGELVEQEMAMLIRRLCSTTANDKTRAQAMEYLFKRGRASPLRTESEPAQAMEHPPLPEGVKARFKCEDCGGTGYTGDMIPGSEFQPPEPVGCTSCNFTGWWAECEAYSADQMRAYVDADRASSGATTQAVRMLTPREIELLREIRLHAQFGLNEGWQREARNLLLELEQYYRTIPPSGEIGGA